MSALARVQEVTLLVVMDSAYHKRLKKCARTGSRIVLRLADETRRRREEMRLEWLEIAARRPHLRNRNIHGRHLTRRKRANRKRERQALVAERVARRDRVAQSAVRVVEVHGPCNIRR